jgi:hypothetical protein
MTLTNEDIKKVGEIVKQQLNQFTEVVATKADLDRMESRLTASQGLVERDAFAKIDEHETRITRLERAKVN